MPVAGAVRAGARSPATRPPTSRPRPRALAAEWGLGKLNDISDEQARDDLGRLSAQMIVDRRPVRARRRRARPTPSRTTVVAQGETAAEQFLLRWRGEADPKHVKAIDTYWICAAEHGLNASTFTARVVASTGADCARRALGGGRRALGPAARRRAARVLNRCSRRSRAWATPRRYVKDAARHAASG